MFEFMTKKEKKEKKEHIFTLEEENEIKKTTDSPLLKIGTFISSESNHLVFLWVLKASFQRFKTKHAKSLQIRHFS